jgi:hypothetical protein
MNPVGFGPDFVFGDFAKNQKCAAPGRIRLLCRQTQAAWPPPENRDPSCPLNQSDLENDCVFRGTYPAELFALAIPGCEHIVDGPAGDVDFDDDVLL